MPKLTSYQDLVEQKIRDDAVLKSIGDGLIVIVDIDMGGKIVYVNKVFEDLTGWKQDEVLHKSFTKVLPREDRNGKIVSVKKRIISRVLSGEKVIADLSSPFFYVRKNGSKFPVASVITPIIHDGTIIGAVETFRDISKESESDKAKSEFASLVSHQLRTPFATINWYIELLLSEDAGKLNAKQKQYLEEAYHASKRMVNLVNVLLSISRIEMGTTIVEAKPTDIVSSAEIILKENKLEIQNKKLKVSTTYGKNIPTVLVDPKQLSMVFQNLLGNAIKYTPAGGKIFIKIELKGKEIVIAIKDTGIGIPKSAQPNIFGRFFRADNAKESEPEGAGLGLYILKSIVDQMKGKIWFESQENKGTTFFVTFPVKYPEVSKTNNGGGE